MRSNCSWNSGTPRVRAAPARVRDAGTRRLPTCRRRRYGCTIFAHDGPGTDQRDLHHNVVELLRRSAAGTTSARGSPPGTSRRIGLLLRVVDLGSSWRQRADRPLRGKASRTSVLSVFERGHPCRARAVDLAMPRSAQSSCPLHDDAARDGGRFKRHDRVELALADYHSPMLSEMARQILNGPRRVRGICRCAGRTHRVPPRGTAGGGLTRILPIPEAEKRGEAGVVS